MAKKKTKLKIAASKMASIAIAHLETLPENEAKAKIASFHRFVAKSSRTSQGVKREKSSANRKARVFVVYPDLPHSLHKFSFIAKTESTLKIL